MKKTSLRLVMEQRLAKPEQGTFSASIGNSANFGFETAACCRRQALGIKDPHRPDPLGPQLLVPEKDLFRRNVLIQEADSNPGSVRTYDSDVCDPLFENSVQGHSGTRKNDPLQVGAKIGPGPHPARRFRFMPGLVGKDRPGRRYDDSAFLAANRTKQAALSKRLDLGRCSAPQVNDLIATKSKRLLRFSHCL
jgi:hypothetical protein